MTGPTSSDRPDTFQATTEAVLFGFPSEPVEVTIRPRARGWRIGGAARTLGIALLVAPAVAIVPPHAPWVIGVLVTGGLLARRRVSERFTLITLEGSCPKCGEALRIKAGRLREPHPLPCEACHHESSLRIPEGVLEAHSAETG